MESSVRENQKMLDIRKSGNEPLIEHGAQPVAIASEVDFERLLAAALEIERERKLKVYRPRAGQPVGSAGAGIASSS
jgi:hypothetical protein